MNTSIWTLDEAERADALDLLKELIRRQSPDPPGNEKAVAVYLSDWFRRRGFDVDIDEFQPERINLITRIAGGTKPSLIFSAHMDTMPIGDNPWVHDPFGAEELNGKIYGRGAADMKSGLAAMAIMMSKIKNSGHPLAGDLILALSAGESSNCLGAERMVERGDLINAGAILVSEPSSLELIIAEKGALWLDITATGKPGHASGKDSENAILKLMSLFDAVQKNPFASHSHPLLGKASLSMNTIKGGNAINMTPDSARATMDIRTVPGMDTEKLINKLKKIAGPGVKFDIRDNKPPVVIDKYDPFINTCRNAILSVRGKMKPPGGVTYFSDSCILVPALNVPRAIIGPGGLGMSGQRDECVNLLDIYTAASIFGEIAMTYLKD